MVSALSVPGHLQRAAVPYREARGYYRDGFCNGHNVALQEWRVCRTCARADKLASAKGRSYFARNGVISTTARQYYFREKSAVDNRAYGIRHGCSQGTA